MSEFSHYSFDSLNMVIIHGSVMFSIILELASILELKLNIESSKHGTDLR